MGQNSQIFYAISNSYNPYVNLAIENSLLLTLPENTKILFIYTNDPCVVMGRFQNPWVECQLDYMALNNVSLVRRQSGGGTVYHDHGNLNWSFIDSHRQIDKDLHQKVLELALKEHGVTVRFSDRTDIFAVTDKGEFKISGSAFKQKKDRNIHHGTLLIDSDLTSLNEILTVKNPDIQTKATESNPNKVINLKKLNPGLTKESLISSLIKSFQINSLSDSIEEIDLDTIIQSHTTRDYEIEMLSFGWQYGQTPFFTHKIEDDSWQLTFQVRKAVIEDLEISSDSFHPTLCELVKDSLIGVHYQSDEIKKAIGPYLQDTENLVDLISKKVII